MKNIKYTLGTVKFPRFESHLLTIEAHYPGIVDWVEREMGMSWAELRLAMRERLLSDIDHEKLQRILEKFNRD